MAYCITLSMGLERIKERVPAWHEAMRAGVAAAVRCAAKTMTGEPCRGLPMVGSDRCRHHLHGRQRDALDHQRTARAVKRLSSRNTRIKEKAESVLRCVARRQLHRAWKLDPTLPGSTLELPESDEKLVRGWLVERGVVLGNRLSARAVDRLRWAGTLALSGRITPESARRRVFTALRDDAAWFEKYGGQP